MSGKPAPGVLPSSLGQSHPLSSSEWNDGEYWGNKFQRKYSHVEGYAIYIECLTDSAKLILYDIPDDDSVSLEDTEALKVNKTKPSESAIRNELKSLSKTVDKEIRHSQHSILAENSREMLRETHHVLDSDDSSTNGSVTLSEDPEITYELKKNTDGTTSIIVVIEQDTDAQTLRELGGFYEALEAEIETLVSRVIMDSKSVSLHRHSPRKFSFLLSNITQQPLNDS